MQNKDNMTPAQARMRFILWDPNDGRIPLDGGKVATAGLLGVVGADNVYLTSYAGYPDGRRPIDLEIGQRIAGVKYSLSGSKGTYDVYRVDDAEAP